MQDLAGLDIAWATRKRLAATRDPAARYVAIADRLCEAGRFGRKTGAGWYRYVGSEALPDPAVEAEVLSESAAKGIERREFADDEIMARLLAAMQAEGAALLAEGIAAGPEAIDVVMVNGFAFPRWRGGPMFMRSA
jgi:3-hydroxyacyl-CoA dehydrogenase